MADPHRAESYGLILRLMERPHAFSFYQAVRRLEGATRRGPRVGATGRLKDDPIRFGQPASLAFAPSTLAGFSSSPERNASRLHIHFFGLLGPNGPMPLHLTEHVYARTRHHHDRTLGSFLDVFHHRLISLFYRAWAINQPAVDFDRSLSDPGSDRFATYVGSVFGLAAESVQRRDSVSDNAKLYYSGRLASQTKHREGLAMLLADYFKVPVRIEPFVGQWLELAPQDQCQLGANPAGGVLGKSVIVGARVWVVTQKFRVVLGPMKLKDYTRLLPNKSSFSRLVDWVKNYTGYEFGFDAQLILKRDEVPRTQLGLGAMLGWTTWIRSGEPTEDADDLVLQSGV